MLALACAPAVLAQESQSDIWNSIDQDGYDLWLRYVPLDEGAADLVNQFDPLMVAPMSAHGNVPTSPTMDLARGEITRGLLGLSTFAVGRDEDRARGQIVLDCPEQRGDGNAGYTIRSQARDIRISGSSDLACLYGSYALLRELAQGADPRTLNITSAPAMPIRMLNHWDNPDGHVERGYAGRSIFDWWHLPERLDRKSVV